MIVVVICRYIECISGHVASIARDKDCFHMKTLQCIFIIGISDSSGEDENATCCES